MNRLIFTLCVALGLVACGGGGDPDEDSSAAALDAQALAANPRSPDPSLEDAPPVSLVNTTTAGDQVFRTIGALADGGYTVAWVSQNTTLFIQRYDSSGNRAGGEIAVPLFVAVFVVPGATQSPRKWPGAPAIWTC